MTIRPGEDWGVSVEVPVDAVTVSTDAELAAQISAGESRPIVVRGGDLHRTLGQPSPGALATRVPIDLLRVNIGDATFTAAAHVLVRRAGPFGWWRGPLVAVMNVDHLGDWDVAPRAHPNDGKLDVVRVDESMSIRDRWQARRRLPTGGHVPHPAIGISRRCDVSLVFDEALAVYVDGIERARAESVSVAVIPDAGFVYA